MQPSRFGLPLLVVVAFTGCGIFKFAEPVVDEPAPHEDGSADQKDGGNNNSNDPCENEKQDGYALIACWDTRSMKAPSCVSAEAGWGSPGPGKWGYTGYAPPPQPKCTIKTKDIYPIKNPSILIKLEHKQNIPKDVLISQYNLTLFIGNVSADIPISTWKYIGEEYSTENLFLRVSEPFDLAIGLQVTPDGTPTQPASWDVRHIAIFEKCSTPSCSPSP